jgi:hypothetical protein
MKKVLIAVAAIAALLKLKMSKPPACTSASKAA